MKRVYTTTEPQDAQMICIVLRDADIEPLLENQGAALYAIGMPTAAIPLAISVRDEDFERAGTLIREYFGSRSKK